MRYLRTIRGQLLVIILICYLIPALAFSTYIGTFLSDDMVRKTEAALSSGVEYAWTLTNQQLQQVISLARDATYDGELTESHTLRAAGTIGDAEFLRRARSYIDRKYGREELLTFALCFTPDRPDLLIGTGASQNAAYQAEVHAAVQTLADTLDTRIGFLREGDGCYLVRNLLDLRMERFGVLVLALNTDRLFASLDEVCRTWDAALTIRLGDVVLTRPGGRTALEAADWADLPAGLHDIHDGHMIYVHRSPATRDAALELCLSLNQGRLYREVYSLQMLMYLLLALLVPVLAGIAVFLHRRILRPIAQLSEAARRIETGEVGLTVPHRSADELGQLSAAFSSMSLRLRELIDKTYKEELALRDAQLQAMQSRINPHFINNALETINWEARLEGSEKISAMVESMSVLLDASMSRRNQRIVPLRDEIQVAQAYLYFISLRFGARLAIQVDVPDGVLDAQVPLLTIQPLLENAVEHGIAPAGGGRLTLSCEAADSGLRLTVRNSGKPLSDEDRRLIDQALSDGGAENGHLGLNNIATRMRLLYNGQASIAIDSDDEGQTVVQVFVPNTQK